MGSTGNSKQNKADAASIQTRVKEAQGAKGSGGGGGGGVSPKPTSIVCPLFVTISLLNSRALKNGTKLQLKVERDNLKIFAGVAELGTMPVQKGKKLTECIAMGFRYPGVVRIDKEGNAHAEFRRTAGA
jgi:hypothetical protein